MSEQISGGNARVSWKPEVTPGVPDFGTEGGTVDTTLAENVSPGATVINVVDGTGAATGQKIRLGDNDNPEYVEILSVNVNEITLDPKTPVSFLHFKGEVFKDVASLSGFTRIPGFVSADAIGQIGRIISDAITSQRGTPKGRGGNVTVAFNMPIELGIIGSGRILRYAMSNDYATTGTAVGGGLSTTLSADTAIDDTSVDLTDVTNGSAGDLVQIGTGDDAEVVKIDAGWDEVSTTVPLDSSTPIRKVHSNGDAVVEVESAAVEHTVKRGTKLESITLLFHMTDNDILYLVKGAVINQINGVNFQPNEETVKMPLAIIAQSVQVLEKDIFAAPSTIAHTSYVPWEIKMQRNNVVTKDIENLNLTFDNQIDGGGGRALSSRFRQSVVPGRGEATGSFGYIFRDATIIRDMLAENNVPLKATFIYSGDTNHEMEFEFPSSLTTGNIGEGIPDSGPISGQKDFAAELDDSTGTDMIMRVKTPELTLA